MQLSNDIVKLYDTRPTIRRKISDYQMSDIIQDQLQPKRFRIADSEYDLYTTEEFLKFLDKCHNLDSLTLLAREKKWTRKLNTGFGYVRLSESDANFFVDSELTLWIVEPWEGTLHQPDPGTDLAII